jgi:F5/8 type C domain
MKRYEWMPGKLLYVSLLLALALIGNPVASAQDIEAGAYPIQNIIATSNAISEEGEGPENTVNGSGLNANNEHSTKATDMWLGAPDNEPVYIQFEFDGVYELQEMWVWNYNVMFESLLGFGVKDVTIAYSANGADWTTLDDAEFAQASAADDYVANTIVPLGGISARYVRLVIRSGWGMLGQFGLSEVRFFSRQGQGQAGPSYALLLDDFEGYSVHEPIFDAWLDGWINQTGSTAGYLEAPFIEREIVNGGLQAMPLFYHNARPPFYSEAWLDLEDDLQNWRAAEAEALTLYFHGSTDQDHHPIADRLYVAVEDERGVLAVVYHPDREALLGDGWQEWTIALEEFDDVDLSRVARLMLGIGDRDNPQPGGNSVVYFDDIGLGATVTPPDTTHFISNVVATSNAISEEQEGPENTVNSSGLNASYEHSTRSTDMWLGELDDEPVYIQFAFDSVYELQEMWVWNYNTQFESILGFGIKDVTIEYSENGADWTVLDDVQFAQGSAQADYAANTIVPLDGISAKYVRLKIRSGWGMLGRFGLSEVKFFSDQVPAPPSYTLLLDDFESYTASKRIYNVWFDGWMNESGSRVGYLEAPFAERGIVNSGLQAMPLFYDNKGFPSYSEAYRELEAQLQDWYVGSADALTLYFHGSTDRDRNIETDGLYVAVEDDRGLVAVVYHGDPEALLSDDWQEWTIDFGQFAGVDLSHVTRLILGVGNRNNPQPGGSSVVYIDDIGLSADTVQ